MKSATCRWGWCENESSSQLGTRLLKKKDRKKQIFSTYMWKKNATGLKQLVTFSSYLLLSQMCRHYVIEVRLRGNIILKNSKLYPLTVSVWSALCNAVLLQDAEFDFCLGFWQTTSFALFKKIWDMTAASWHFQFYYNISLLYQLYYFILIYIFFVASCLTYRGNSNFSQFRFFYIPIW